MAVGDAMTNAVVIGSGPNGLAAALTLAHAGVNVRVIEADDVLGGGMRSSELTLPGLIHDECSAMHPLAVRSEFTRRFDLEGAGLRWRWAAAEYAHPLRDGQGGVAWRSIADTADALGREAGGRWRRLFGPFADRFDRLTRLIAKPQMSLPRDPLLLAGFGGLAAIPAAAVARMLGHATAGALFLGAAAHAFRPLQSIGSTSIGLTLAAAAHAHGWPVAVGGSSSIRDAIVRRCIEHGVSFETGRLVRSIEDLGDSTEIVMLDTTPSAAAAILGDRLPLGVRRAYSRFRHGPAAFKVDFAVEGGIPWSHEASRYASTVHVGGTVNEIVASENAVSQGKLPENLFVLVGQQYLADETRSRGELHPVCTYAHVPHGFTGDLTATITQRIEEFAPGFRDRIRATFTRTTAQLADHNANYIGGDITTGRNDIWQLLARPRLSPDPYFTGVSGVYLCSAATPPGAGAHGLCGYNAARRALAELERM